MDSPSIKFVSWSFPGVSYTLASIAYIKALAKKGVSLSWETVPHLPDLKDDPNEHLKSLLYSKTDYDIVLFHLFTEVAAPLLAQERNKKKFIVIYTTWETTIIPDAWTEVLNQVDLVLVPCNWNKQTFQSSGVRTPIEVIPHIYDLPSTPYQKPFQKNLPYRFYSIGELCRRKGQLENLECYLDSFTADDPVVLTIKASRYFFLTKRRSENIVRKIWEKYKNPATVELIDYYLPQDALEQLHQSSHCFLSLTKGEGWGLGAFEAGGLGNPVLIPRMGGQADFLPKDYKTTIDYTMVPIPYYWQEPDYRGLWAEPSKKSAGALMQKLVQDYCQASSWEETISYQEGQKLQQFIQQNFSAEKVATQLIAALEKHYHPKK